MNHTLYRPAVAEDAKHIAELIAISSDGVAVIEWQADADEQGNSTALDMGIKLYADPDGDYSYRNCTIAEVDGKTAGMMLAFSMPEDCIPRSQRKRPNEDDENVFAPYMYLEEPDSWYVCGVAAYPEYRGQGVGSELMQIAEDQARAAGLDKLSLVVFEQNTGAIKLYDRLGYVVVDHAPIVPHPMIPYTGEALLMVKAL